MKDWKGNDIKVGDHVIYYCTYSSVSGMIDTNTGVVKKILNPAWFVWNKGGIIRDEPMLKGLKELIPPFGVVACIKGLSDNEEEYFNHSHQICYN